MLTIGADPEFFITHVKTGKVVPIIDKLGGTKDNPFRKDTWPNGYAVQEDNVMAEYNIPPCVDSYSFYESILFGRKCVLEVVGPRSYKAYPECFYKFDHDTLEHPQARRFGCSPDNDGYNMGAPHAMIRPEALNDTDGGWRFAGGHIHMGYRDDIPWLPDFVAASMSDAFISIPMLASGMDPQGPRRAFYGLPGRYRPTEYGIEYRTLGNRWTLDPACAEMTGRYALNMLATIQQAGEATLRQWYHEFPWLAIKHAIATENAGECLTLNRQIQNFTGGSRRAA